MDKLKGESIPRKECYERAEGTGHSEEGLLLRTAECWKKEYVKRDLSDEEKQVWRAGRVSQVQRTAWEKASGGERAHGTLEKLDHGKQGEAGAWV